MATALVAAGMAAVPARAASDTVADPVRVIVTLRAGSSVDAALANLDGVPHKITHRYRSFPLLALEVSPKALGALRASPQVASIQEDGLSIPALADSTGIVGAKEATQHGFDGTGRVVAVLDTGVDRTHPFLAGRIVHEACFSLRANCPAGTTSQVGVGAGAPCAFAPDDCQHGTHVAGIAAGRRHAGAAYDGVAPDAKVMPVQVFSRFTGGECFVGAPPATVCALSFVSDQIAGLQHVLDRVAEGVPVAAVNMSLGTVATTPLACDGDARKPAIDALRANGIPTVIASGNSSSSTGVSTPACISTAVTVGNTTKTDTVRPSSNSSPQVELLAPGTAITSSVPGGGTAAFTGTSMAAPHVAGAWAVYLERFPGSTVDTVLNALRATGKPVTDPRNSVTVPRLRLSAAMAGWGFVWADRPSTVIGVPYTPDALYQANSTGATNTITREGTGVYLVRLPNLGGYEAATNQVGGGNVQVTAYGDGNERCKVQGWGVGGRDLHVRVRCHTPAGVLADARYTVLYQANETVRDGADSGYAWVGGAGTPSMLYQANSSGAVNTVTHTPGTGIYTVTFPGLTRGGGNAQVTGYGTTTEYCKIRSTSTTAIETRVIVGCHNAAGTLTDSVFTVAYTAGEVPSGRKGAHGLAFDATSTAWYLASPRFNTSGGAVWARRTVDPGVYEVLLSGMPSMDDTNVIVTAYGSGGTTCRVHNWVTSLSGEDTTVTVGCLTPAGTPANHPFSILYTTDL